MKFLFATIFLVVSLWIGQKVFTKKEKYDWADSCYYIKLIPILFLPVLCIIFFRLKFFSTIGIFLWVGEILWLFFCFFYAFYRVFAKGD